jgi:hypothetical protein
MRRYLLVVALAAVMLIASAGAAFAGEVKGPPGAPYETTPIDDGVASSACAFSGLNDGNPPPGQTQNWGHWPDRPGPGDIFHPGNGCNPNGIPLP